MKITVEQTLNNLSLLPRFFENEEIRQQLIEKGIEVGPYLYQVECRCGRFQTIKDNIDSINVENPQCWGCLLAQREKKGLKACFGILTSLDTERWYSYKICPTSLKATSLLLYGKWDDPFEVNKRLKRKKKTG
jgi:hypothetical protein